MFCPNDGVKLTPKRANTSTVVYKPCPDCGECWAEVDGHIAADGKERLADMEEERPRCRA